MLGQCIKSSALHIRGIGKMRHNRFINLTCTPFSVLVKFHYICAVTGSRLYITFIGYNQD